MLYNSYIKCTICNTNVQLHNFFSLTTVQCTTNCTNMFNAYYRSMAGGPENDILIEETGPDFVVRWGFSHFPRWWHFPRWQHFPRWRYYDQKLFFFSLWYGTVPLSLDFYYIKYWICINNLKGQIKYLCSQIAFSWAGCYIL